MKVNHSSDSPHSDSSSKNLLNELKSELSQQLKQEEKKLFEERAQKMKNLKQQIHKLNVLETRVADLDIVAEEKIMYESLNKNRKKMVESLEAKLKSSQATENEIKNVKDDLEEENKTLKSKLEEKQKAIGQYQLEIKELKLINFNSRLTIEREVKSSNAKKKEIILLKNTIQEMADKHKAVYTDFRGIVTKYCDVNDNTEALTSPPSGDNSDKNENISNNKKVTEEAAKKKDDLESNSDDGVSDSEGPTLYSLDGESDSEG